MKKFFNSLFIAIAAMVVFAGCAKQEINEPAISETKTVQFYAESIGTKTAFGTPEDGTYPTLWSTNDAVKILVNLEQIANTEKEVFVSCSDDFKSARFTAELATPEAESFTFYSISPADAFLGKSSAKGRLYVTIPAAQTPLTTSVDMAAQLLYASSETTETMPTSVELTYHHLTAYGKLSLTNLTPNVSSVSEIKLEAPEDVYIAGNWDYFVADGSFAVRSDKGSNSIVLSTTNTNDIWFACAPVDMSGKKMTLTVTTDKGDLKKEITFPEDRKFKAGRISKFTVDMAGIEVDAPEVVSAYYEKVTSEPADWCGTYLMVCTSKSMALSGISTTDTKYGIGSKVTIEDNKIAATDELASSQIVISPSLTTEDAYLMAFNGGYLSWTSGNSLNVSDEDNTNSNWKITVSDANVSISNCKDATRKIVWNASSPRFACYTTAQTAIQLYKLAESEGGETPEPKPKTLVSIKVENPKIVYTAGDAFVAPDVTATYDDESTETVIGATFTGYDMATAGTYTVTVSYTEGEVTAKTTYQITINELTAGVIDVLTRAVTGITNTSYSGWSGKTLTSSAVYAGQSAGGNDAIQLRSSNSNSGIVTTESGGYVKKMVVTWNSNTAEGRTLNVYGKNSAYSEATDLYDNNKQGTLLGTIVCGKSTELEITGNYQYIGLRSADGAMYLDEIKIIWSSEASDVPAVPELAVDPATVEVTVAGGNAEFGYTVTNPTEGVSVLASTTVDWISAFNYTTANKVIFTVAENTSTEAREAVITLSYEGAESKKVTVKQDAAEASEPEAGGTITISKYISEISGTSEDGTKVSMMIIDENITASASTNGNNGKVYNSGAQWRLYQSDKGTLTISAKAGYIIKSLKFTYNISNGGTLLSGSTEVAPGTTHNVDASSITYSVGNTGSATNGQVRLTAIEVVYKAK